LLGSPGIFHLHAEIRDGYCPSLPQTKGSAPPDSPQQEEPDAAYKTGQPCLAVVLGSGAESSSCCWPGRRPSPGAYLCALEHSGDCDDPPSHASSHRPRASILFTIVSSMKGLSIPQCHVSVGTEGLFTRRESRKGQAHCCTIRYFVTRQSTSYLIAKPELRFTMDRLRSCGRPWPVTGYL